MSTEMLIFFAVLFFGLTPFSRGLLGARRRPPTSPAGYISLFSALLHQADSWQGCGLGREFWETKTLRIPAKVGFLRQ